MVKTLEIKQEPGPGRRQCPKCEIYVASRTKVCECGYEFPVGQSGKKGGKKSATAPQGLKAMVEELRRLKQFINGFGGLDATLKTITDITAMIDEYGGVDNLVESLREAADIQIVVGADATPQPAPVKPQKKAV